MALRVSDDELDLGVSSFEDLYRTYATRVRALLRNRFRRDSGRVDDLVQEVFLRAYRSRAALEPGRDPWPWLCTIALNLAIDEQRRPVREFATERIATAPSDTTDPWEHYVSGERGSALKAAMGTMPERSRRLVLLKDAAGYDYDELAEVDGSTVQALRCAVLRARRRLRESYSAELASRGLAAMVAPFGRVLLPGLGRWQYRLRRANEVGTITGVATSSGFAAIVVGVAGLLPLAGGASAHHPLSKTTIAAITPATAHALTSFMSADATPLKPVTAAGAPTDPGAKPAGLQPHVTVNVAPPSANSPRPEYGIGAGLGGWIDAMVDDEQGVKCSKSSQDCAQIHTGPRHIPAPVP